MLYGVYVTREFEPIWEDFFSEYKDFKHNLFTSEKKDKKLERDYRKIKQYSSLEIYWDFIRKDYVFHDLRY